MEDLLAELQKGRIRVPHFQRPLRWQRADAWELLDSILRGYPIGTLLLWKGAQNIGERTNRLGRGAISGGAADPDDQGGEDLWVVDGQQRLDALSRMLLGDEREPFLVWLDLDLPEPEPFRPTREQIAADRARWIPVRELRDAEAQLEWAFSVGLSVERRARAFQLGRRLREYEVPAYIIEAESETVLRQVFKRVNSTGKQMKESEVFDALHGNTEGTSGASLEALGDGLRTLSFGDISPQILLQLVAVLVGHDIGNLNSLTLDSTQLTATFERVRLAATSAVGFFVQDARIPHMRLLPYSHLFVAIARFFDRFPDAAPLIRRQLAMGIWRGLITENASPTIRTIRTLIKLLSEPNATPAAVTERFVAQLGEGGRRDLTPMGAFSFSAARAKLRVLAMWSLTPLDPKTMQPVSAADVLDNDGSIATLVPSLPRVGAGALSGNRLFYPDRNHIRRELLAAPPQVLESHLLPTDSLPELDDAEGWANVVVEREERISELERSFADRMAAWEERTRPPISELQIADDEAL